MKKIILFLSLFFSFPLYTAFGASGSCSHAGVFNTTYTCVTNSPKMVFYSFSGAINSEYNTYHRVVYNGTNYNIESRWVGGGTTPYTIYWTDAVTPGPIGATGATGATGQTGATGSVDIQGTVNNLILTVSGGLSSSVSVGSSFPTYSGVVIQGYFDNMSASHDLPSWNLVLHLNAFGTLDGAEPDIVLNGTGLQIFSATSIQDVSDPRIVFNIRRITEGDFISCGWYGINVPSSLIQGFEGGALTNYYDIGTAFELTGCEGYNQQTPETIIFSGSLGQTGTGFVPPSASGSYFAITYKDSVSGATYVDFWALVYLMLYLSGILAIFYGFFVLFRKSLVGKK